MPKQRMNPDKNNQFFEFVNSSLYQIYESRINCHMIAQVTNYRPEVNPKRLDAVPLPLQTDGNIRATLVDVLIPDSILKFDQLITDINNKDSSITSVKPLLHVNSVIWIGYCDRSLENYAGMGNYNLDDYRMHSIQDAVVESVIQA